MEGFFARGHAIGDALHGLQIGGDTAAIAQRGIELRQHVIGLADQRDHGRRGRAAAVEHAVEHALDLPAELTQRACTDQTATALQGVEHAADRAQAVQVVRRDAPGREQIAQVHQFLVELFDEDLADVLVDVLAIVLEAGFDAGVSGERGNRRGDRRSGVHRGIDRRPFRAELRGRRIQFGQEPGGGVVQFDTADHRVLHGRRRQRRLDGVGGSVEIRRKRAARCFGAVLRRGDRNLLQEGRQCFDIHLVLREGNGIPAISGGRIAVVDLQRQHIVGVVQILIEGEFDRLVAQLQGVVLGGDRIESVACRHEGRQRLGRAYVVDGGMFR